MFVLDLVLGPVLVTILITVPTLLFLYWYSTRNHGYWKKKGIPSAKTIPFFGSLIESTFKPLHEIELKRYGELGRLYGHFEGNRALLSVAHPELLRSILVKDFHLFTNRRSLATGDKIVDKMLTAIEGEDWKRVRTIITPTFTTGKIKRMINIFKECSKSLVQNFETSSKSGERIDAKRIYGAFTMDVIASTAFSTKLDSYNDPENKFVKAARDAFTRNVSWRIILFLLAPRINRFFKISIFLPSAVKFFHSVTMEIIGERKRTGQTRNDFLQLLMDTAKEVSEEQADDETEKDTIAENYGEHGSSLKTYKNISSKNLSMDELVAQCVIFFLAGYDTTASTLSFASYLLALHPHIQDQLRAEIDEVLQQENDELTYEAIHRMKYLDNVISETLRMFPPLSRLERVAQEDYKLGDTGITIPKGMIVTIPNQAIHKDPHFWPDPEKFDPNRFTPEERAKRDPYIYLPFGSGPRNCVGMRFALMEIKVCLVYVLSTFKIKRSPHTKDSLEYYVGQGLLQPKEIAIDFEMRSDRKPIK